MGFLKIPGAQLYYETYGRGPLLLMIHGANGTGKIFYAVVPHLAKHYTVAIYDRRGYCSSKLDGLQRETSWLKADVDDACRLVEHLSDKPAIIFGNSSGAIVALETFVSKPSAIQTLVPHEPPLMMLLPEAKKWAEVFSEIYTLYQSSGVKLAMDKFLEAVNPGSVRQAISLGPRSKQALANSAHWFEYELRQYPSINLNLEILRAYANSILPVAGRESRAQPAYKASVELARRLGRNLIELPGGHVGFRTHPAQFARELHENLTLADHD